MNEEKIENLRNIIKDLKILLEKATLEKGLAAEENKDIRENFAYDYWDLQETNLTLRIHRTMQEIRDLTKPTKTKSLRKTGLKSTEKIKMDLPKNKWL